MAWQDLACDFEMNDEHFEEGDINGDLAYMAAGVAVKGYKSELPRGKKMQMYSSVGDEERKRADEIKEERDQLEYQH